MKAFDLAERLQTPVFVLSDLDIGMNIWMSDPFRYPDKPWDRGKVLAAEDLAKVSTFERYRDLDHDGIPYRTLPGTDHPLAGYFTRGSGHDERAAYTENPEAYKRLMDRLAAKFETARSFVPPPVVERARGATTGILGFGSSHWAIVEARDVLAEDGLKTNYLLLKAYPFTKEVRSFIDACDRVYVVEQNRDGQMKALLTMEYPDLAMKLRSILHYDGLSIDAESIVDQVKEREREGVLAR
jgi:2-oxoglutarate ferredoxin oxidoreductase subunit alpha